MADFPRTDRETFEAHIPHHDPNHQEARPQPVRTYAVWVDQAHRQIQTFGMLYGEEHVAERQGALETLIGMNREDRNQWTDTEIMAIWEELCYDWWDELRMSLRDILDRYRTYRDRDLAPKT